MLPKAKSTAWNSRNIPSNTCQSNSLCFDCLQTYTACADRHFGLCWDYMLQYRKDLRKPIGLIFEEHFFFIYNFREIMRNFRELTRNFRELTQNVRE